MNARIAALVFTVLAASCAPSRETSHQADEYLAAAKAVAPSVVFVEYELKFDKGEARGEEGWSYDAERLIAQERPMELDGFLLEPTIVLTPDPMLHPRFIKSIRVRHGEERVGAEVAGYIIDYNAVLLRLAKPLDGTQPLVFDTEAKPPYFDVCYDLDEDGWTVEVSPFSRALSISESGQTFFQNWKYCAVTDKRGAPIGMPMGQRLPIDDSWKGSPLKWPAVTAAEMPRLLSHLENRTNSGLLRVKLDFRSPKTDGPGWMSFRMGEDDENATERNVIGMLVEKRKIIVLANLKPKVTARLDRITVYPAEGKPVAAKFLHTAKDYGCFAAALEKPLPGPVTRSEQDVTAIHGKLMLSAEIIVQGDKMVAYFIHNRISRYEMGWKRRIYPDLHGEGDNVFLFDLEGRLVAFPVSHREKSVVQNRWSEPDPQLTPVAFLNEMAGGRDEQIAQGNVPLSEEEENRLAWLGVEMQALNKELARVSNVSDLTQDGETGTLISYVYPDSPAAKAEIQPGWVLLRLHVEGQPKPLEVKLEEGYYTEAFPWHRLDEVPEEFYDRIPTPWPSAENSLTRALTDIGFGNKFTADFFHDGKTVPVQMTIVESPAHYGSAPKYKSAELGVTLRDLTYEVRRYFQKKPGEPGLIVSKIEPGGKASVGGIKPYEIITHVNDKPVTSVEDFKKLISGQKELRLSVKRMTRGRLVPIKISDPDKKEDQPEEKDDSKENAENE